MPQHQSVSAARKPASDKSVPNLGRHTRKCAICNHPDRDSIDADIISWRSASTITLDYALPARSSIYRHAAATGLLQRRQRNLRGACERIIERVDEAPPSASAVLRALRIYAQITDDGQWLEPAKRSIVTHVHITKHDSPLSPLGAPSSAPSAEGRMVSVSAPSPAESATPPPDDSLGEISINTRWNKRLPSRFDPEILIATQNASRGEPSSTEQST